MKNNDSLLITNETDIPKDQNSLKSLETSVGSINSANNTGTPVKEGNKIYLKSIQNTNTEVYLNLNSLVKNELSNILRCLNVNEITHDIKLIFSGKILSVDQTFTSYGILVYNILSIFINFSYTPIGIKDSFVLLYMLKEKENIRVNSGSVIDQDVDLLVENAEQGMRNFDNVSNNVNAPVNSNVVNPENVSQEDLRAMITTRGFSRFREYGMSPQEIHMFRVVFHTNYLVANRGNSTALNSSTLWNPREVIRREEEWIQQINNDSVNRRESDLSNARRRFINQYGNGPSLRFFSTFSGRNQDTVINIMVSTVIKFNLLI